MNISLGLTKILEDSFMFSLALICCSICVPTDLTAKIVHPGNPYVYDGQVSLNYENRNTNKELMLYHSGEWGYVCIQDSVFTDQFLDTACRTMGFTNFDQANPAPFRYYKIVFSHDISMWEFVLSPFMQSVL